MTYCTNKARAEIYCDIANCQLQLNKFDQVITSVRRAQEEVRSCSQAYVIEAIALAKLSKISAAEEGDMLAEEGDTLSEEGGTLGPEGNTVSEEDDTLSEEDDTLRCEAAR